MHQLEKIRRTTATGAAPPENNRAGQGPREQGSACSNARFPVCVSGEQGLEAGVTLLHQTPPVLQSPWVSSVGGAWWLLMLVFFLHD